VHSALVIHHRRLLAVIDREDLPVPSVEETEHQPVVGLGTLAGRIVHHSTKLGAARRLIAAAGRRRLAVIDSEGCCRGLLCLKRSGNGFCTDEDVAARSRDR
jgi:hypothetical protein